MGFLHMMNSEGCGWDDLVTCPVIFVQVLRKAAKIQGHKSGSNEGLGE
jgi:hypothetical protein